MREVNSWSEENLKAVIETPQKLRSMTTDDATVPRAVPEVHEQENQNEEATENDDEDGETPQTTRIMTWRERRFQSQTQQRRRAQAEETSSQKHKGTCS